MLFSMRHFLENEVLMMNKKKLWLILLLPISGLITLVAKNNPYIAEYVFARGIYRVYATLWGSITSLLPFSLMELGIIVLPILAIVLIVKWIVGIVRHKTPQKSDFDGMAQQIGAGGHALAAFGLQFGDIKASAVAAGHLDALLTG